MCVYIYIYIYIYIYYISLFIYVTRVTTVFLQKEDFIQEGVFFLHQIGFLSQSHQVRRCRGRTREQSWIT